MITEQVRHKREETCQKEVSRVVVDLLKITRETTADYRTAKASYKGKMRDYEDVILDFQESEIDECMNCPYKGTQCQNQCMEIIVQYNQVLNTAYK